MKDEVLKFYPNAEIEHFDNPRCCAIWSKPISPTIQRDLLGVGRDEPEAWKDAIKSVRYRCGQKQR